MLNRFAILVAVCVLLVVASGAIVTSSRETLADLERLNAITGIRLSRQSGFGDTIATLLRS